MKTLSSVDMLFKIQDHLKSGGIVQITTYAKSWIYKSADWFRVTGNVLEVKSGKRWLALTLSNGRVLVGIKFGRMA